MGTINGVIGGITGKVGNMVFFYRNGKYVSREYIPNPSNPQTARQSGQRLKMALSGRLSKVVPYAAIEGFVGSRTDRRSRFLSNLLLGTTVSGGKAAIADGDIVFSEGTMPVLCSHSVSVGTASTFTRYVNIGTTLASSDIPEGYGERYVILFLDTTGSLFDYCLTGLVNVPRTEGSSTTTSVALKVGAESLSYAALVYVYPFALAEGFRGRFRSSYLGTEEGTVVVDLESGESVVGALRYGRSQFLGRLEVVPPSQG